MCGRSSYDDAGLHSESVAPDDRADRASGGGEKGLAEDVRDKFAEAKALGFDVKVLRQVIRLRKKSKDDRDEEQAVLETYLHALGMLADDPPQTMMAAE